MRATSMEKCGSARHMTYDSADGSRSAVPASEKLACQARRSPFRLDRNENYETRCALAGSRLAIPYRWGFWAALVLVFAPTPIDARAADPAFVGTLALAVDPEVAQQLKIPPEVREKLQTIVDQRESEALAGRPSQPVHGWHARSASCISVPSTSSGCGQTPSSPSEAAQGDQ